MVEHTFTTSDGVGLKWHNFAADVPAKANIVAIHGIQSHAGWYRESCLRFAQSGYPVSFLDRRGSGANPENRGDCPSFRRLVDDIAEFMATIPKPRFLLAISWGAKLAVALQRRHPGLNSGLILITPGFRPHVNPRIITKLAIAATRFIRPTKLFPIPLNEPELFTSNPGRREFIANDPLALHQATARLLFESRRLDIYDRLARRNVTVPTLVLLAGQDRIINSRKTRKYVEHFKSSNLKIVEYPDAHHTLDFESAGPPHLDDVIAWLQSLT